MKGSNIHDYLDKLAEKDGKFTVERSRAKIKVGLGRLEVCTSQLVVPCLEGSSTDILCALLSTNLFSNVKEIADYINDNIESHLDPHFSETWKAFYQLVGLLGVRGERHNSIEIYYTALFFSAIVLRSYFEAMENGTVGHSNVKINPQTIAESFFLATKAKAASLSVDFNPEGHLLPKIDELGIFLQEVVSDLR